MKRPLIGVLVLVMALALGTLGAVEPTKRARSSAPKLESDSDKTLYAIGLAMSANLAQFRLSEAELDVVKIGLTDGVLGRKQQVETTDYQTKIRELAVARIALTSEENKKAGAAAVDEAVAKEGALKHERGFAIKTVAAGTGKTPGPTDMVKVHYTGKLLDGTVFDSSVQRNQPLEFALGRVVPCWTEGVQLMKEGGKAVLWCPSDVAYGDEGRPPRIPPGATLIFEVELLEVKTPGAPPPEEN